MVQERGVLGRKQSARVQRVTFTAVTAAAVTAALKAPRHIDRELVQAYLTRLSMDYLLGFTLSPVLWTRLPGTKSAGRVQSPALLLICEREAARDLFTVQDYFTVTAQLAASADAQATVRGRAVLLPSQETHVHN
jgi:DNA topoisomerase I